MTEEKAAPPSVSALRMLMVLQRLKRRDFLQSFDLDGRCDSERLMNALTFLFLTEFDSPEYGKALQRLIPIINYELTDGKMASADVKKRASASSSSSSSKLEQKMKGAYNAWQVLMFSVCHSAGVDHEVWDPRPFISEGFDSNGRIGAMFDYERVYDREALLVPVMKPLRQTIDKRINALRRHDRATLQAVQELQLPSMLKILLDDAARGRVNMLWHDAKRIHALFFRHTNITQPVLLAAMMYCGFTKNGVKSSMDLRDKSESMHELFYLLMDLAVPRSEYSHEYEYQRGPVDFYDSSMRTRDGTKRHAKADRNDMAALKDVLANIGNESDGQKASSSTPPTQQQQFTFKANQKALKTENKSPQQQQQNGEAIEPMAPLKTVKPRKPLPPLFKEVYLDDVDYIPEQIDALEEGQLYAPITEQSPKCNIWWPIASECGYHICCHRSMFVDFQPLENCAIWPSMSAFDEQGYHDLVLDRVLGVGTVRILVKDNDTGRGLWATLTQVLYIPSAKMNQFVIDHYSEGLNYRNYRGHLEGLLFKYTAVEQPDLKLTPEPDDEYVSLVALNDNYVIADYHVEVYNEVVNTEVPPDDEDKTFLLSDGCLVKVETETDDEGVVRIKGAQQMAFVESLHS